VRADNTNGSNEQIKIASRDENDEIELEDSFAQKKKKRRRETVENKQFGDGRHQSARVVSSEDVVHNRRP
jgi:hypothetical protein